MKIRINMDTQKLTTEIAVINGKKYGFTSNKPFIFGYSKDLKTLCETMKDDIDMIVSTTDQAPK